MYANYHTHSYHCHHATGQPQDYVEAAIRGGIQVLGFSDHNPCSFTTGHRSHFRMDETETATYVAEIQALQEQYQGQIQLYIGYEMEYYPHELHHVLANLRRYPCDYLILGQHFTFDEYDGVYAAGKQADTEETLHQYVRQTVAGMETGLFSCVTHPDLIRFTGDEATYTQAMRPLCLAAQRLDIPLEFNFLGLRRGKHYPNPLFWQLAGEVQAPVILGCDAHEPENLDDPATLNEAMAWVQTYHLSVRRELTLRPVGEGVS